MMFYHGTSSEKWMEIQTEGFLLGKRSSGCRVTWLCTKRRYAEKYGNIILEVNYNPDYPNKVDEKGIPVHNYFDEHCWQLRVYEPIPLNQINRVIVKEEEQ